MLTRLVFLSCAGSAQRAKALQCALLSRRDLISVANRHQLLSTSSARPLSSEGSNVEGAKRILREAEAVCFDVDSTVCPEEGIDVLAEFCGAAEQVAELTNKAMGGSMLFQDAIRERLELMKPSLAIVEKCLREHPPQLSPGMKDLASLLHDKGCHVYLVSGGFRIMIAPVAQMLGVSPERIYANTILFDKAGNYTGFDETEPTSRDGGKPYVVGQLKKMHGYRNVVMVGDGATDMQAKPPADAFIGYGGVTVRNAVKKGADWYVYTLDDLVQVVAGGRK